MLATEVLSMPADRRFAAHHRWDRNALALMLALVWLGVLMGFGGNAVRHGFNYPLIVHLHAAAFIGWMLLFTTQALLIRNGRQALHKKLGLSGAGLAIVMVVLGPVTGIVTQTLGFGDPRSDPPFLSISFLSIAVFAGLVGAALALRSNSAAHKRLMLLASIDLSGAGFARWVGGPIIHAIGPGPLGLWALVYLVPTVLVLSIGVYDLVTRRRLLRAYVLGSLFSVALQVASIGLYFSPAWKTLTVQMVGH